MLRRALRLLELAWSIVPVDRLKRPLIGGDELAHAFETPATRAELMRWAERWSWANVAVACGNVSGVVVLDLEFEGLGLLDEYLIPSTACSMTPSGGRHLFFEYDASIRTSTWDEGGVRFADIKSDRSLVMLPPSIVDNTRYEWLISPFERELSEAPPLLRPHARFPLHSGSRTREGFDAGNYASRSEADLASALRLLRSGLPLEAVEATVRDGDAARARRRQGPQYARRTVARAQRWIDDTVPDVEVVRVAHTADGVQLSLRVLCGPHINRRLMMRVPPPSSGGRCRRTQIFDAVGLSRDEGVGRLKGKRFAVQLLVRDNFIQLGSVSQSLSASRGPRT